jgi:hypothetical protein
LAFLQVYLNLARFQVALYGFIRADRMANAASAAIILIDVYSGARFAHSIISHLAGL